jgi:hypothetical protein
MPGDGPCRDDGGGEEAGWAWELLRPLLSGKGLLLQYNIAGCPWQDCGERGGLVEWCKWFPIAGVCWRKDNAGIAGKRHLAGLSAKKFNPRAQSLGARHQPAGCARRAPPHL